MKYHGCILEFAEERNNELMRVYRNIIASRSFIDSEDVVKELVNTPCSRFWISEERALRVVNAINKGFPILYGMLSTKREMFLEIYKRVMKLRKRLPKASLYECVIKVVNSPAPKFYMSANSAREIIRKMRSKNLRPIAY